MQSKARILGHPIHPILIVFPLGLLSTSLVFDGLRMVTGKRELARVSKSMIGAGLVGGLLAAPFGLIDWLAIPRGTRAWRIGLLHGVGNLLVTGLFSGSYLLRCKDRVGGAALALSLVGMGLSGLTGWLGGELVDRLGVGVDDGANLDAPSSLSGQPAYSPMWNGATAAPPAGTAPPA